MNVAQANAAQPKLLDRMRDIIRTRHYSIRTEEAYRCRSAGRAYPAPARPGTEGMDVTFKAAPRAKHKGAEALDLLLEG